MAIRSYQPGDMPQIQELFHKVFQKKLTKERWEWKYLQNPEPKNPWVLVFEEDGRILGHIALWVSTAYVEGKEKKIALRVDTMVDPGARGKGIYKQLNQQMVQAARESGIAYLYGFPAPKAKELLLRYTDGYHAADISRYMLVVKPGNVAAAMYRFLSPLAGLGNTLQHLRLRKQLQPLTGQYRVEQVTLCDSDFDKLADQAKTTKPFLLKRDAAYLNWRYHRHPEIEYTMLAVYKQQLLIGYIVVKTGETEVKTGTVKTGYIVDWLSLPENGAWQHLLQGGLNHLKDTDVIQTWVFPGSHGAEALAASGFKEKDKPMPFVVHDLLEEKGATAAAPGSWWLTQGDVDSF